jgi:hypothetical protein
MLLATQCSFCFQPHSHLSLVIKETIEATVVEVHAHIGLRIRIVRRILSVRTKKIRLTPRIMTQCVDAEHSASGAADSRSEARVQAIGALSATFHDTAPLPCARLLEHLVCQYQERRGKCDPEGLSRLHVED